MPQSRQQPAQSASPREPRMPTFVTIGYGDRAGDDRTPEPLL
ncbi:hypothetical protein [Ramlibacter cellulosilyticus]|nr:hypothetical protein [Ramlibacter cellulosilyticus]